jgi:hypothetical protein
MDFDIDAVLDQLEKTRKIFFIRNLLSFEFCIFIPVNQSDLGEKETNQHVQTSSPPSASRKSIDELSLLDLDPFGNTENHTNQDNDDKLERLKQDLQDLYASSTVINPPLIPTPTLPDIIGQQEELSSIALPLAVEHLEIEVREEILHHTLEQSSSPLLLPDLTTLLNGNHEDKKESSLLSTSSNSIEEHLSPIPMIETTQISNNFLFQNEPDLIQHETSNVLHSVDSIVNVPMISDLEVRNNCFFQQNYLNKNISQ